MPNRVSQHEEEVLLDSESLFSPDIFVLYALLTWEVYLNSAPNLLFVLRNYLPIVWLGGTVL